MSAAVALHRGVPTLFLDGKPAFAGYLWVAPPEPEHFAMARCARGYAQVGIHLYAFDVGTQGPAPEWRAPSFPGGSCFDFSTVRQRFEQVLAIDPEARFHLRVHLEMPKWWQELHPQECELAHDGTRLAQSFASAIWQLQAKDFLRAYIRHLRAIGLSERVIAYQVCAGTTGEWVKPTAMAHLCGDYSRPMQQHFREWLRSAYNGDVQALREAWADPEVTFEGAGVPPPELQLGPLRRTLRTDPREQRAVDYFRCLAELCAALVCQFCQIVKEETVGKALAGAFFGYLLEMAWNAGFFAEGPDSEYSSYQRSGHLGLRAVLQCPYVDFIVSPYSYGFRGVGGEPAPMPPLGSVQLHGKLYIMEDDTRTHVSAHDPNYGRARSPEESLALLQRNLAAALVRGHGIWWLGGGPATPHIDPAVEPAFGALLRRFSELGRFALELDRSSVAEVAAFLDDESLFWESARNDLSFPLVFAQRLWGLARFGAPCDYYLLSDLLDCQVPDQYRLLIFLNAFCLEGSRRERLRQELGRRRATVLWLYAPGYLSPSPSLAAMEDLTGFRFGLGERPWPAYMHITDSQHPLTRELPPGCAWGCDSRLAPVFHLEDDSATVLGEVVYAQGRCKPGLALKEQEGWRSVYCAVPNLPAPFLRALARFAGAHLYGQAGDVIYASRELLAVHTAAGGQRTFALRQPAEIVFELFQGQEIARGTESFTASLPPASTALYYIGPAELLAKLPK